MVLLRHHEFEKSHSEIKCSVLNLPITTVDLDAGFLGFGGHSFSVIDLVSACRSYGGHISVENIILNNTIADILNSAEWLQPSRTDKEFIGAPSNFSDKGYLHS